MGYRRAASPSTPGSLTARSSRISASFWLKKPQDDAAAIVVHALLESPSCTGAYRFTIRPGVATQMDVEMTIFPRRDLEHVGIAPLTSMYLFDALNSASFDDYRPAVHDTDGLMMVTGAGEWLWRPLANPKTLQVSAFIDNNPGGFGLMQRKRKYRRLSSISKPSTNAGRACGSSPSATGVPGFVELYEIPTRAEIHDNIAVFWQPKQKPTAGRVGLLSSTGSIGATSGRLAALRHWRSPARRDPDST